MKLVEFKSSNMQPSVNIKTPDITRLSTAARKFEDIWHEKARCSSMLQLLGESTQITQVAIVY